MIVFPVKLALGLPLAKSVLLQVVLVALVMSLGSCAAIAAPHLLHQREPDVVHIGPRFQERLSGTAQSKRSMQVYPASVRILFLRVDFQQNLNPSTTGDGTWSDPAYAFGTPPDSNYWVSRNATRLADYYREVSGGLLDLQVTISPPLGWAPYRLNHAMASYGADNAGSIEALTYDSVTAADAAGVNFAQYDAIVVVHAGAGEETDTAGNSPGDIWSLYYADSAMGPNETPLIVDGKTITEVLLMPQTGVQDGNVVDPLGVYAHEFGHWLGLPDLYATGSFIYPDWDGIGAWGLMGSGLYNRNAQDQPYGSSPAHPEAWSKLYLGWVQVVEFPGPLDPGNVTLGGVQTQLEVWKFPAGVGAGSQYFLLENRRRAGFDQGLPGEGIFVWLVDPQVINFYFSSNSVNANPRRPGVALIEADGDNALRTIETGCGTVAGACDDGSAGDSYPGSADNTTLTPVSMPAATPYAGSGWLNLTDIQTDGQGNVSLRAGFGPSTQLSISGEWNCGALSLSWSAQPVTDVVSYRVYRNGQMIAELAAGPFTDTQAKAGDRYAVAALDAAGDVTAANWVAPADTGTCVRSDSRCFIATAAYGSPQAPYVALFRQFRDRYLLTHPLGRVAVRAYYEASPPIADFVRRHDTVRASVRVALMPAALIAWVFVSAHTSLQISLIAALLILPLALRSVRQRRVHLTKY